MKYKPSIYNLSNGVTVILDPMEIESTIVKVCFQTGARDEQPNEYGITHFCEHMMGRGTKNFPRKKLLDDYIEEHGGLRNAATGYSALVFRGKILPENVNVLIGLLGEQIRDSLFLPERIELERPVIIDELRRMMDDPEEQLGYFISNNLFGGATLCYRTLGTVANIMSFTREQMLDWLARRLSAKNCIICVSGRILNHANLLKCLERNFSFLPTHDVPVNTEIIYTPKIIHNLSPYKKNVKLRILFPDIWKQTFENFYNQKCVNQFEAFMSRRLYRILRYENGLVYDFSGASIGNERYNWSGFGTETSRDNIAKTVALIAKTAHDFYENTNILQKDLNRLRCQNKLFFADFLESADARSRMLISFYYDFGCLYDYRDAIEMSSRITVEDVIEKSRGYFNGPMSIVTQGAEFQADLESVWHENFK